MTDLYVRGGTDPAFVVAVTRADGSPVDLTDPAVRAWFTARDPVDRKSVV